MASNEVNYPQLSAQFLTFVVNSLKVRRRTVITIVIEKLPTNQCGFCLYLSKKATEGRMHFDAFNPSQAT